MQDAPTDPPPKATRPAWQRLAAALVTTALFVLAFPTTELGPLAFVALVPLLVASRGRTRWQRFRLGWLAGIAIELILFRWIPFTMTEMTSIAGPLTWGMAAAYALWHGLRFGVFLMLAEPLRRAAMPPSGRLSWRSSWRGPVVVALVYAVVEWAWPVIFPWAFAHAVWELPGAAGVLALQGVPLSTALIALVNAALAELWFDRRAITVAVPLASVFGIVAVATITAPGPSGDSLRVAIVQPNYTLAEKKHANTAMRLALLTRFEAQLRALPPATYDLVIASEGAFPMWWRLDADAADAPKNLQLDATRRLQRAVAEGPRTHAIIGGLRQDGERTRNSAVHLSPDGQILGHYDKQTLVPFSEYLPLADVFPALANIRGIGNVLPGETACAFEVPLAGRATPLHVACGICYESMFANKTRADAGPAEVLVNLTIDTWFGASTAPRMHLATQASRAAELGIPLVRSALTGISASIDSDGQLVQDLPRDLPGVLDARVTLGTGATLYRAIGQWFAPLATIICVALGAVAWRRARRARLASKPLEQTA